VTPEELEQKRSERAKQLERLRKKAKEITSQPTAGPLLDETVAEMYVQSEILSRLIRARAHTRDKDDLLFLTKAIPVYRDVRGAILNVIARRAQLEGGGPGATKQKSLGSRSKVESGRPTTRNRAAVRGRSGSEVVDGKILALEGVGKPPVEVAVGDGPDDEDGAGREDVPEGPAGGVHEG
jgi:hypothetical protein